MQGPRLLFASNSCTLRAAAASSWTMGADRKAGDNSQDEKPAQGAKSSARAERLAAQLKANLRRRKYQARARAEPDPEGSG
jgi:hypothetical protein